MTNSEDSREMLELNVTTSGEVVTIKVWFDDIIHAAKALHEIGKVEYVSQLVSMYQGGDDFDDEEDEDW